MEERFAQGDRSSLAGAFGEEDQGLLFEQPDSV